MEELARRHRLLEAVDDVVRVPFLVKGRLVLPPEMSRAEVVAAFAAVEGDRSYLKLPHAQLLREPIMDRTRMAYTERVRYQILPPVDPFELIEQDIDALVSGPYALKVEEALEYLDNLLARMRQSGDLVPRVLELVRAVSDHPDGYLEGSFLGLHLGLDRSAARALIDNELSAWQQPGSRFLDEWVEVAPLLLPGLSALLAASLRGGKPPGPPPRSAVIRAMPTRQLHITAGNAPQIPFISALRMILTKSVGVIKCPFDVTLPGALLTLAALASAPDHPLTRHLSVVYWQGGDEAIETVLFAPGMFERISVWGAPDAVASVQSRALFTRVIAFNPRFSVSMIGREAFADDLGAVAFAACVDTMIYNQKACTASLVHYVEGDDDQVRRYAECVRETLARWDELVKQHVPPALPGRLRLMERGKYARAQWLLNKKDGAFVSGVVVMPDGFNILDHPLSRLVAVRRVNDLREALTHLHLGVSSVGVYPEARRLALRDAIAARGVSSILPLGEGERLFPGAPHDGMMVLNQMVDWKHA